MSAPPGWYQDPQGLHGHHRWWDGTSWTEQRIAPAGAQVPAAWNPVRWARRHPLATVLAALFGLVVVYGAVDSSGEQPSVRDRMTSGNETGERAEPEDERAAGSKLRTFLVTRIVDGDTLELGNGETVRLVGIDAPERGECGHERAAGTLARLVLDKSVLLGESDEDRDRYGRLLHYIDIGSQDAGLRLIQNGLAIARYDSRDGYGFHPREHRYIAADKGTKQLGCQ